MYTGGRRTPCTLRTNRALPLAFIPPEKSLDPTGPCTQLPELADCGRYLTDHLWMAQEKGNMHYLVCQAATLHGAGKRVMVHML